MKKVSAVLLMFLMFSSCMSVTDISECLQNPLACIEKLDPVEAYKSLNNEDKATLEGAAVGGTVGGLSGYLIGRDTKSTLIGAAIGTTIGGVAARSMQKSLNKDKAELEKKKNDLDARIKYAEKLNDNAQKYNQDLEKEIIDYEKKAEELREKQRHNAIKKEELGKERAELVGRLQTAQETERMLAEELADLREFRKTQKGVEGEKLDVEIAELTKTHKEIKAKVLKLASTKC